jgi:hypothetical protein
MANKIRSIAISLLAGFIASVALCAESEISISQFGTLADKYNPSIIGSNMAQDLLNVDISPGGLSVKKRKGYVVETQLSLSNDPVSGVYNYEGHEDGNVSLYFNNIVGYRSVNGSTIAAPALAVYNTSQPIAWDCIDNAGYAYCLYSSSDSSYPKGLIKFVSSGWVTVSVPSTGTMLTSTPERAVMAGIPDAKNDVAFSKVNDLETWAIGPQATDPIRFTIVAPGKEITHITYVFGRVMWFKDSSFGYIMTGVEPAFADWSIRTISPTIGTLSNDSTFHNGILYFRGNDQEFYAFDGSNLSKLSDAINVIPDAYNSEEITTTSEFNEGSFSSPLFVDTMSVSGQISLTFPETFSTKRDGTDGTMKLWNFVGSNPSDGKLVFNAAKSSSSYAYLNFDRYSGENNGYSLESSNRGFSYNIFQFDGPANYFDFYAVDVSTTLNIKCLSNSSNQISSCTITVTNDVRTKDMSTTLSSVDYYQFSVYLPAASNVLTIIAKAHRYVRDVYPNETESDTLFTDIHSYKHIFSTNTYCYFKFSNTATTGSSRQAKIDTFSIYSSSVIYLSKVINAPSWDHWGQYSINYSAYNDDYSPIDYYSTVLSYIRSSTFSFSATDTTPAWTAVSNGAVPTVSTGTYFQLKVYPLIHDEGQYYFPNELTPVVIEDISMSWYESTTTANTSVSTYFDDAIWWSIARTGLTNNYIYKFDLNNKGWLVYNFGASHFMTRSNDLFFGSPTEGIVYRYGYTNDDNGTAINAYWKSKDFIDPNPFVEKELTKYSIGGKSESGSLVNVTYTFDGVESDAEEISFYKSRNKFFKANKNVAAGTTFNSFSVNIGNDTLGSPFEVFIAQFGLDTKPWTVTSE